MDKYTKFILTVIAVALIGILVKGDGVCGLQSNLIKWNYFDKFLKLKNFYL